MTIIQPYPHYEISVEDKSKAELLQIKDLPLNRSLFILPTQMGVPNEPIWCESFTVAKNLFGAATFDPADPKYYSPAAHMLLKTLRNNGAFITRAADAKALPAISLLCAAVKVNQEIPQFEIDSITGNYKLTAQGNKIPIYVDPLATPLVQKTEKGATVRYLMLTDLTEIAEALDHTYSASATTDLLKLKEVLAILTSPDFTSNPLTGTTDAVIIPILLVMAKTPGSYGNDLGFSIDYNRNLNSSSAVNGRNAFIYSFSPHKKIYGTVNPVAVKTIFNTESFSCSLTPECVDKNTKLDYSMKKVISENYPIKTNNLMMDFYPIYPNLNLLSAVMAYYEDSIPDLDIALFNTNGTPKNDITGEQLQTALDNYKYAGMFNIFGLRDPQGRVYEKIIALPANEDVGFVDVGFKKNLIMGSDGDIFQKSVYKEYLTQFLALEINPNIEDSPRYPFNYMVDCGFDVTNKYDMLDFMAVRDDVQIHVGTYIHPKYHADPKWDGVTTPDQDISLGSLLRERALLIRESIEKGTNSCRASIFAQAGYEAGARYPVPIQFWVAEKLSMYDNLTYLVQDIAGLPYSEVDMFNEMIWIPSTKALKSLTWDRGINYCQYFDRDRYHFAAMRTCYDNDTSLLSDDSFVRMIVYTKHEVRQTWAKYAGVKAPINNLQAALKRDVEGRLTKMFNGKYSFDVKVYQTADDSILGYVQRVQINITSGAPYRVGIFEIVCYKDGYNG